MIYRSLLTIFFVCLFSIPSMAQNEALKIGVVDIEKILSNSLAGKSIENQLKIKREAFQKEFSSRENNLLNSEKTLIQEKATLTAEAFEEKRKQFETQLLETRNLFQKRRNSLDKGLSAALGKLRENIIRVTAEIAEQEGHTVILTRDSVVITSKEMDITSKVLSKMDSSIQSIPLTVVE